MNGQHTKRRRSSEAGVAMLIAIFVLLLIAIVGITLILSSGTETALAGNYRSSTAVYYAALAGLEEARGRLLLKNANYFNVFPAPAGTPLPTGQVWYITNPTNGGNVLTDYPDNEFNKEFGPGALAGATVTPIPSVSTLAGIQGPLYRWVRINAVTETSLNLDINNDGTATDPGVIYYDGAHLTLNPTSSQALEITALAVLPNNTQKLLQYVVAPLVVAPNPSNPSFLFPAALTLVGNKVNFQAPGTSTFFIKGQDQGTPGCNTTTNLQATAIGYTNGGDTSYSNIVAGATPAADFPGENGPGAGGPPPPSVSPSIQNVSGLMPQNWQTPSGLEQLVQDITKSADVFLTPSTPLAPGSYATFTQSDLPTSTMSQSNPMTIVVNGNLNLTGWHGIGYGILVVRGQFNYDPDATWNGIVLVVGVGNFVSNKGGTGQFNGAMLIANTLDSHGNVLATLGPASFSQTGGSPSGSGIYYSSCLVRFAQPIAYKVLSFREIPQ